LCFFVAGGQKSCDSPENQALGSESLPQVLNQSLAIELCKKGRDAGVGCVGGQGAIAILQVKIVRQLDRKCLPKIGGNASAVDLTGLMEDDTAVSKFGLVARCADLKLTAQHQEEMGKLVVVRGHGSGAREALEDADLNCEEAAARCGTEFTATKKLLNALSACGYLECREGRYRLARAATWNYNRRT